MRKTVLTLIVAIIGLSSNSLYAVTKTLIDFNQYEQKIASEPAFAKTTDAAQEQKEKEDGIFKVTSDDMKMEHWMVVLNSSSRQVQNMKFSYAKAVQTKGLVGGAPRTVLGARIHFPEWANIASAQIAPPYEFPAYTTDGKATSVENGVIDNTGEILSITTEVYGRNFDYAFFIQLRNHNGEVEKYYLGQLYFSGWRKLTWKNPMYIDNVDLREIKRLPIFPDKGIPYKKLDSFLVVKNQRNPGGNFLVYVASVVVDYDLAVIVEDEDIDQEAAWSILADATKAKVDRENKERSDLVELKQQELKKMALSRGQAPNTEANGGNAAAQPAGAAPAA